jgi:hypothetical protein
MVCAHSIACIFLGNDVHVIFIEKYDILVDILALSLRRVTQNEIGHT